MNTAIEELFGPRVPFPEPIARDRLAELVGLDEHQEALAKFLGVAINPDALTHWFAAHHPEAGDYRTTFLRRPPLAVLAGDVGSGKTVLAESIGHRIATEQKIKVTLFPMSLTTRGQGRVGEMTQLITEAFDQVHSEATKYRREEGPPGAGILLLVDEADALAQSREESQMHHEDRAGVNAFIRGVDRLSEPRLPAAVVMCTNRLSALDPAIRRRAGEVLTFRRPEPSEIHALLAPILSKFGFGQADVEAVVRAAGSRDNRTYGFTYSDVMQRLLPGIVMRAYPNTRVDINASIAFAESLMPTPPFEESPPG